MVNEEQTVSGKTGILSQSTVRTCNPATSLSRYRTTVFLGLCKDSYGNHVTYIFLRNTKFKQLESKQFAGACGQAGCVRSCDFNFVGCLFIYSYLQDVVEGLLNTSRRMRRSFSLELAFQNAPPKKMKSNCYYFFGKIPTGIFRHRYGIMDLVLA